LPKSPTAAALGVIEPWEVPHDPGAQSMILSAPEGVFIDHRRGDGSRERYPELNDDDDDDGGLMFPW